MANNQNQTESIKTWSENLLSDEKRQQYKFVQDRIEELKKTRTNHYGHNLDALWSDADKDYIPHRLKTKGMRVVATDEDKGWRGALVNLGSSDWQSDVSQSNPFVKIQTALSILVDQNPTGIFTSVTSKYEATTNLIKQLYARSWEVARSKQQLKLFVFNLAKYGWAAARTYPLKIERETRVLAQIDEENPDNNIYETKTVCEFNDIFRENLDPRNVWIDDMAKPNNGFSVRDWTWRKVYSYDQAKEEFGKYKNFDYVQKQAGTTTETVADKTGATKEYQGKDLVEVYFYENKAKDLFMVLVGGVPVIIEPLPISDARGNKRLSLWQTYWNLRHAESPYGIGIYEAIRYNQGLLDRIRNMTIDQLTLSIYKMFFYQGTQNLQETGDITIKPGVGKQVIDPKNITWLEVPGPGKDAWEGMAMMRKDIDEDSGITDPLLGLVTGKTAFEIAQAKEAALKRLKNPFDNILEALNDEAYTTVSLIQLIYSIPETIRITDPKLINDYIQEIGGDEDLYERVDSVNEETGEPQSQFTAKIYKEFPLSLDKDEKGHLIETDQTRFFRIKPQYLKWEGIINVKAQSILTPSKQVDKALDLEFYNMFIPLLSTLEQERIMASQGGQQPTIDDLAHGKVAKSIAKLYDKDPQDVLPASWFQVPPQPQPALPQDKPLIVPAGNQGGQPSASQPQPQANQPLIVPAGQTQAPDAQKFVPSTQPPERPQGIAAKISGKMTQPYR